MSELDAQERAFAAHITDLLHAAAHRHQTRFTGFLDLRQAAIARQLASQWEFGILLYGGYPDAERVMFGAFAPYESPQIEAFEIVSVTVSFREQDAIGHRDLLGALLNLGLARETVGDILVEKGRAVCFLTPPAANLALDELQKVGRSGVRWSRGVSGELPQKQFWGLQINIPSLRLDCTVAAILKLSREKAQTLVRGQQVFVNGAATQENSLQIAPGDVLSVRGHGKFVVDEILRTTKKERLVLQCRKYL